MYNMAVPEPNSCESGMTCVNLYRFSESPVSLYHRSIYNYTCTTCLVMPLHALIRLTLQLIAALILP